MSQPALSSVLAQLVEPVPPAPNQILSAVASPILAQIDAIIRLQLLYPFGTPGELGKLCQPPRTARQVATIIETAAYKAIFEKRRRDLDIAVGLPTLAEEIDGAARMAIHRLAEKIETTDDGYLIKQGTEVLLKARGLGGFAPTPPPVVTNVLVDARQASILEIRDAALAQAREAGPVPQPAAGGTPEKQATDVADVAEPVALPSPPSPRPPVEPMSDIAIRAAPLMDRPALGAPTSNPDELEKMLLTLPGVKR